MTIDLPNSNTVSKRSKWFLLGTLLLLFGILVLVAGVAAYQECQVLSREAGVAKRLRKCGIRVGFRDGWARPSNVNYMHTYFGDRISSLGFSLFPRIASRPLDDLLPELQRLESLHSISIALPICEGRAGFGEADIDEELPILQQLPSIRDVWFYGLYEGKAKRVINSLQQLHVERVVFFCCEVQDDEFTEISRLKELRRLDWIPGYPNFSQPGLERFQKNRPEVTVLSWNSLDAWRKSLGKEPHS